MRKVLLEHKTRPTDFGIKREIVIRPYGAGVVQFEQRK